MTIAACILFPLGALWLKRRLESAGGLVDRYNDLVVSEEWRRTHGVEVGKQWRR
jgi:hypothetical protein